MSHHRRNLPALTAVAARRTMPGRTRLGRVLAILLTLGLALAAGLTPVSARADSGDGLVRTDVSFVGGDGLTLHGTIIAPDRPAGPRTGVVLISGSGPHPRSDLRAHAEGLARVGLVTLSYDKRTVGYSLTRRNYNLLAADALAALQTLRRHPGVDPGRVGLWGVSEGAWVAPLATVASRDVAFLITVGGSAMAAAQQTAWYWENRLRYLGVRGSLLTAFSVTGTRLAVDAGMFPEAHYDGLAVLERVRVPVLLLWGEDDINHPPAESSELMEAALERGGNRSHTTRFIVGGGRDLLETTDQGFRELPTLAPGYPPLVASWVDDLADGPPPSSSAPAPIQDRRTQPLAPMAWWESAPVQLAAVVAMALGLLSYPALTLLHHLRRRRTAVPATPSPLARTAAVAMALALLGWLALMSVLQVTRVESVGPVLFGRPVAWLATELAAAVGAAAVVALMVQAARGRADGKPSFHARGQILTGLVFLPWAAYWGLLIP